MLFSRIYIHFLQLLNCTKLAPLTHFNDVYLEKKKKTQIGYWNKLIFPALGNLIPILDHFYLLTVDGFRLGPNRQLPILSDQRGVLEKPQHLIHLIHFIPTIYTHF